MRVVVVGAGVVGLCSAWFLRRDGHEVTVVDTNEDSLRELQDRLDIRTVNGNGASPSVLESAGAAQADIIVALTSSDEVNMLACQIAHTLFKTPTKIARIRAPEYFQREGLLGAEAGGIPAAAGSGGDGTGVGVGGALAAAGIRTTCCLLPAGQGVRCRVGTSLLLEVQR